MYLGVISCLDWTLFLFRTSCYCAVASQPFFSGDFLYSHRFLTAAFQRVAIPLALHKSVWKDQPPPSHQYLWDPEAVCRAVHHGRQWYTHLHFIRINGAESRQYGPVLRRSLVSEPLETTIVRWCLAVLFSPFPLLNCYVPDQRLWLAPSFIRSNHCRGRKNVQAIWMLIHLFLDW